MPSVVTTKGPSSGPGASGSSSSCVGSVGFCCIHSPSLFIVLWTVPARVIGVRFFCLLDSPGRCGLSWGRVCHVEQDCSLLCHVSDSVSGRIRGVLCVSLFIVLWTVPVRVFGVRLFYSLLDFPGQCGLCWGHVGFPRSVWPFLGVRGFPRSV